MQLKLLDENKAAVFGLPQADTDSAEIDEQYLAQGWDVVQIARHVDAAIAAGAYARIDETARAETPTGGEK